MKDIEVEIIGEITKDNLKEFSDRLAMAIISQYSEDGAIFILDNLKKES